METILAAAEAPDAQTRTALLLAREAPRVACGTASVCDSVFSIPGTALASAGLAALAGGIYDRNA